MRRALFVSLALLASGGMVGCANNVIPKTSAEANDLFAPREVKLHPVFTKIANWEGTDAPDGIEALVELHDQFGDTCKGAGTFTFELFEFSKDQPDPRGRRLSNPWISEVITSDEQEERWSKTSRCYAFRLASEVVRTGGTYVLAVTFAPVGGPRSFDKVVLTAAPPSDPTDVPPPSPLPPAPSPGVAPGAAP